MAQKVTMEVIKIDKIAKDTVEMTLKNSYISHNAKAGQFIHIFVEGCTLRRPISIADVDRDEEIITILFKRSGSGTKKLAESKIGSYLDVLGPSGNGFDMETEEISTVLLVGGGIGVPPMHYLGKMLKEENIQVISVLGFQSRDHVFYEEKFQEFGETFVVTNDGSYGDRGFVIDVLHKISSFDRYYACGPTPMLKAITDSLSEKEGFISLEERMGCGIGACFACVIPTKDSKGYKKICSDGPVFHAAEVEL